MITITTQLHNKDLFSCLHLETTLDLLFKRLLYSEKPTMCSFYFKQPAIWRSCIMFIYFLPFSISTVSQFLCYSFHTSLDSIIWMMLPPKVSLVIAKSLLPKFVFFIVPVYILFCCQQYWTSPGGNTPQRNSYMATYHPSWKLSKLDKPDMWNTAEEVGTSS